ncbi:MAG: hypothetical protein ACFFC9_12610 [Promethearchaeota archaeon]
MKSKIQIGYNIGLVGSVLVILWPIMWFLPIMGPPAAFQNLQNFMWAIISILMGILGIIGGRIGKAGKKNVSVILLLLAGICVIINNLTINFLLYDSFHILYFLLPPHGLTLFGGILVLLSGIIVLVSKDEKNL